MQRQDVIKILGILKTAYPRFYANLSKEDANEAINLWLEMFQETEPQVLAIAVKNLINTLQFPPTIADVKNEIYKLSNQKKLPIELWNELRNAVSRGYYYATEIFPTLSKELQVFLKNPMQLKELATVDTDTFDTVIRGQFLKQVEVIQQREKENVIMLPDRQKFISELAERMSNQKLIGE